MKLNSFLGRNELSDLRLPAHFLFQLSEGFSVFVTKIDSSFSFFKFTNSDIENPIW